MSRVNEILIEALKFENGHIRRTQHILKVHSLAKLFAEKLGLDKKALELLGGPDVVTTPLWWNQK